MLKVRQVYYKDLQLNFNMKETTEFEPLYNPSCDHFLESGIIKRMYLEGDCDSEYYGIVSHKFFKKLHKTGFYVQQKIEEYPTSPDVFSFFGKVGKVNLVNQGTNWHPKFKDIYKRIAKLMNWDIEIDLPSNKMEPIFSNHWIAKKEVFEEFCKDYLIPVMKLMESDRKLKKWCFEDANYISREKLSPEGCLKVFGKPYYTYHCFILERLFPIYCFIENKEVVHI